MNNAGFRADVRAWLQANCPAGMRGPGEIPDGGARQPITDPDQKLWLERCAQRGFTVPTWPEAYGGAGMDNEKYLILLEEMRALNIRIPIQGIGTLLLGPTLLEFGTEAQKARHLPPIARGEVRWCQGYSEPAAGSDLASLQTRAVLHGDRFIINGQKIWTSGANFADWMFCLVRTDPAAPKHDGISMLLIDMDQPGVTTRRIQMISGESPFCETFFNDAVAHTDGVVGELNRGWGIAKRLLQHERSGIAVIAGGAAKVSASASPLAALATAYAPDTALIRRMLDHTMRDRAYRLTLRRRLEESREGYSPGGESSAMELIAAELDKEAGELAMLARGTLGLGWSGDGFSTEELKSTREWLSIKRRSIARGSNEVQLNVVAKRVLGLPDEAT